MADVTSLDELDEEKVDQADDFLATALGETHPRLDLTPGRVNRDILVRPNALLRSLEREDLDRERRSHSLLEISEDPALADDDIVDGVLSNLLVTRKAGERSDGLVAIVISANVTTAVPEGTLFTANGFDFTVTTSYVGVTDPAAVLTEQERLIEARGDGTFVFTVPVEAVDDGSDAQITKNTRFTVSPSIANQIDVFAPEDFTQGLNEETTEELVERAQEGIAPSVFSGRIQIQSLIGDADQGGLSDIKASSIVGFGDPEMLRDRHNIFETSHGGKADIYTQTELSPQLVKLTLLATLIDATNKIWQLSMDRDTAPAFYVISSIVPKNEDTFVGTLQIVQEIRGLDLSLRDGHDKTPDIVGLVEGAFTAFQTSVVQFIDPDTDTAGLVENESTQEYDVFVFQMANIKTLQDLSIRDKRNPQADYLMRAPAPAFTAVSLQVQRLDGQDPDADAIRTAVSDRVNSLGFNTGRLPSSVITDAAHDALDKKGTYVVTPLDMFAFLYPPDTVPSGRILLRDPNLLEIPDLPDRGVTQRTAMFFLRPDDVSVDITNMETVQI
jgi:hypothetical protein